MTDRVDQALCLPEKTREVLAKVTGPQRHPGLLLDRLSLHDDWRQTDGKVDPSWKRDSLDRVRGAKGDPVLLDEIVVRQRRLLQAAGSRLLRFRCAAPLALHLARSATLENVGLALHPLHGFAYIPGSGLKGLTRSWAERVWQPQQADAAVAEACLQRLFGMAGKEGARAGVLVFHDGLPLTWPQLQLGIANVHHPKYYGETNVLPGDWESPLPNSFLQVASGTGFELAIGLRGDGDAQDLQQAQDWLTQALAWEGAGAKTSSGLGRLLPVEAPPPIDPRPAETQHESQLTLVSPAFLAGAEQQAADCELSGTTLRGLLRWWWRTLHADALSLKELKDLEGLVWGDTDQGIGVVLQLAPEGERRVVDYAEAKGGGSGGALVERNRLQAPRDRKTVMGLFYNSYGMADGSNQRHYLAEGAAWRVSLSARDHRRKDRAMVSAALLLQQARDALWLFCRFGGAGSKARKGYGSFADVADAETKEALLERAAAFRKTVLGHARSERPLDRNEVSCLSGAGIWEVPTEWTNRWDALNHLGSALQVEAKALTGQDRALLGLPRKAGGSNLRGAHGDRHASPLHFHLAEGEGGRLVVRLIAFPVTAMLPAGRARQDAAERLLATAKRIADRLQAQSQDRSAQTRTWHPGGAAAAAETPGGGLREGQEVQVVLSLDKKGRWAGKLADTGLTGKSKAVIVNAAQQSIKEGSAPESWSEGAKVSVLVAKLTESPTAGIIELLLQYLTPEELARQQQKQQRPKGKHARRR